MKCKDCNVIGCPNIGSNAVFSKPCTIINQDSFDWQSFRNQAAKDILCAIISQPNLGYYGDEIENAVIFADKLIFKLKEKEA